MTHITREEAKKMVGKGWSKLIDCVYDHLDTMYPAGLRGLETLVVGEVTRVTTVKEKFGGLRIYVDHADPKTFDVIDEMENESLRTCEECGEAGETGGDGWIKTLCDTCRSQS